MFNIKHNECVGFESRWEVKKVYYNNESQTTNYSVSNKSVNTTEKRNQDVQTVNTNQTNDADKIYNQNVDMEKLAKWLNNIYRKIEHNLDNTNSSRIFRKYQFLNNQIDDTCKLILSIEISGFDHYTSDGTKPKISNMDWNCNGKLLAVTCTFTHESWCYHTGLIMIYVFNRDKKLNDLPKKRLSTESCVTALKYHPLNEGILAAGTISGNIHIWNIENEIDSNLYTIVGHNDCITQILWMSDVVSYKNIMLASSSTDGLIKLWNFSNSDHFLQIKTIYKLRTPIFGHITRSTTIQRSLINTDLGIVAFDFSKYFADMFVVATEGGLVARCSILGTTLIKGPDANTEYYDPVYKYYEPHKGEILNVKFSPFKKNIFVTSATDGEIRIYLIEQDEPVQIIFTDLMALNGLSFIPYEEGFLVTTTENGTLAIYNLIRGQCVKIKFDMDIAKNCLLSLAVNSKNENFITTGNDNGKLELWHVPWQSINM